MTLFLEEAGLPIGSSRSISARASKFKPEFLAISPNNKIPAMVDHAPKGGGKPVSLFESGAMLLYLAEKIGRFHPDRRPCRAEVLQWLFWQVGGLGPMAGQNGHFNVYAPEKVPYAIERYTKETNRLYGVMNKRLADRDFLAAITRSPIWLHIPGSSPTNPTAKTSPTSRVSSAGSRQSPPGRYHQGL